MLTEVQANSEWRVLQALPPCRTTEEFEEPDHVRFPGSPTPSASESNNQYRWNDVPHPTKVHKAVHDLFSTLKARARVKDADLVAATMILHRAGFGLVVYRSPRPGCIQVFNKKFGEAPISLVDEPLEVGLLIKAVKEFV